MQHYFSRVRGGHNYFYIRTGDKPIYAMRERLDILIALDKASIDEHLGELDSGVVILDRESLKVDTEDEAFFHVPLRSVAEEVGGSRLYTNTVATGAALGLLCYPFEILSAVIEQTFEKKGCDVVERNISSARAGYDYAQKHYPDRCHISLKPRETPDRRMLITGNDAVGLGALASGLKFLSAYPMTPSTGVMNYVASKADLLGVVVEQAEDEISALTMALGASFAGVRAMTTTSGGGFSLMVEALGLAGMTETPIVIFLCQRPGPATGLPTMTEQGDLEFVLHAAQGEFPRCVLAPRTADEAIYLTAKAFNIADKYQIPVFILSDQHLADTVFSIERFDLNRVNVERHLAKDSELDGTGYMRYKFTKSGVSPRLLPGTVGAVVVADSDEHDESGHIDESAENRIKMTDKRMAKLGGLSGEITPPEVYGKVDADLSLIGWGSTYGALRETVDSLERKGLSVNLISFSDIYPFSEQKTMKILGKTRETVCVENNATGQFARVLRTELGFTVSHSILKYDGLPFTPEHIIRELKKMEVV